MLNEKETKRISKFMSFVLRHKPEEIGLVLDEQGWASVTQLIDKMNTQGFIITFDMLKHVVTTNVKQRFAFNHDQSMIRASQGHSVEIELNLEAKQPPPYLYHGTADRFVAAIMEEGLSKMERQHVHLSSDVNTAKAVGGRHGKPIVLQVAAGQMHSDGFAFYLSANGVWLTGHVPAVYIKQA